MSTSEFNHKKITIYPNPTKTILNIDIANGVLPDRVVVTDLAGKKLMQTHNTKDINVADLASGIYIIEAILGNEKFFSKFVKE